MSRRKRRKLTFDRRGGVVVISRDMLGSAAYLNLSAQAKALMLLMQVHWNPDKPVAYGVREAEQKIGCSRKTAMRAFRELREAGFIRLVDESLFCSRSSSRSRTWRLTWMPTPIAKPPHDWEKNELNDIKTA